MDHLDFVTNGGKTTLCVGFSKERNHCEAYHSNLSYLFVWTLVILRSILTMPRSTIPCIPVITARCKTMCWSAYWLVLQIFTPTVSFPSMNKDKKCHSFFYIYTSSVFCYDKHKKNFDIHFSNKRQAWRMSRLLRRLFWIPPCRVFKNGYFIAKTGQFW